MKSKFNKSDTVYPHGSLREQPDASKEPKGKDYELSGNYMTAYINWRDSGRIITCSENNWKDGQELVQDVDYTLSHSIPLNQIIAVPLPVQETEDELWKELIEFITKRFYEGWTYGEVKTETEKSFTIQRRKQ